MHTKRALRILACETLNDLEGLLPAWEELQAAVPTATIFSTWEWLSSWWRAFGDRRQLWTLAFFDSDQRLVALAPLALDNHHISTGLGFRILRLMGDGSQDSDNLDMLVLPGLEEEFVSSLLDYLAAEVSRWDFAQLNTLPGHSPAGNVLLRQLGQHRWTHFNYPLSGTVVDLPTDWESYLNQLSSKERGKLGIRSRRLEKNYRVRFRKCTDTTELSADLDALFELHQRHWQLRNRRGSFASLARRRFYNEIGRLFLARRWLEFWLLELDGKKVAAQFAFRYGDTVFSLQEGFDPAYSTDSVGYVLRGHVIKQVVTEGAKHYDFLAGVEDSKLRWSAHVRTYMNIHFAKPLSAGSFYLYSKHKGREGKEWLRAHLPDRAWALLHGFKNRLRGVTG